MSSAASQCHGQRMERARAASIDMGLLHYQHSTILSEISEIKTFKPLQNKKWSSTWNASKDSEKKAIEAIKPTDLTSIPSGKVSVTLNSLKPCISRQDAFIQCDSSPTNQRKIGKNPIQVLQSPKACGTSNLDSGTSNLTIVQHHIRRFRRVHTSLPHTKIHKVKRQPTKLCRSVSITENHQGFVCRLNQYHIKQEIGRGSYGLVKLAYDADDSNYYALKILSKSRFRRNLGLLRRMPLRDRSVSNASSSSAPTSAAPEKPLSPAVTDPLHRVYQEIAILKRLDHPNIVKLVEVLDDPEQDHLYMVFEYVQNGPVMVVGEDPPIPESRAWIYFRDTVLGLEYLHFHKIVHRDIKPANLLLSNSGSIKIADFGVSNEFTDDDVLLRNTIGTPAFMAPESVTEGVQHFSGKPMDIWSLGVTLYCMLYGHVPYSQTERFALYHAIVNDPISFSEKEQNLSENVVDLLNKMLVKDPHERLLLPAVKVHPWVTRYQEQPLPPKEENCADGIFELTEDDVCNSVHLTVRLETLIFVKILLHRRSFRNPMLSRHPHHKMI